MKKWTRETLEAEGYKIENARITSVDMSMADHGCLTLSIGLEGYPWACVYGGYVLGHGFVDCEDEFFEGTPAGMESIMRIMDVTDSDRFQDMKGKIVRVAIKGWGSSIKIIGNCVKEKWFDIDSFFKDKKEEE